MHLDLFLCDIYVDELGCLHAKEQCYECYQDEEDDFPH